MSALFIIKKIIDMTKITNTYVLDKAKMSVLLLIMLFTCPLAFAQSEPETAKPLTDM